MDFSTILPLLLLLACPLMMILMMRGHGHGHGHGGGHGRHAHGDGTSRGGHGCCEGGGEQEPALDELRAQRDELDARIEALEGASPESTTVRTSP